MVKPGQLPPTELFAVKGFEHLDCFLKLGGYGDRSDARVGEGPGSLLQHSDEVVDADLSAAVC